MEKRIGFFERYLTLWVALCMALGMGLGRLAPDPVSVLRGMEIAEGSQINPAIAVLIWLMIYGCIGEGLNELGIKGVRLHERCIMDCFWRHSRLDRQYNHED